MPPKRPQRKAAVEAKARFGSDRNRSTRRGTGAEGSPQDGGNPSASDKDPANAPKPEPSLDKIPDMNAEDVVVEAEGGKEEVKAERQNEGEASTAPVPEKVRR
jgi:hypothetical protein